MSVPVTPVTPVTPVPQDVPVALREVPAPAGLATARTLPAAWYADPAFHQLERARVFRGGWVCAGVVDDLPDPGSWTARTVGSVPVLIVRDRQGVLRAFQNVCRHRGAPLCDEGARESGALLRCPYHAWLYRLDGTLAKAQGVGAPEGFDLQDHALRPVAIAIWRRFVFTNVADTSAALDLGPLAAAIDACDMESMELAVSETDDRAFNWKVLLENYSENYHTPFVHPEIDTSSTEDYPMVSDGPILYAWDRTLRPSADPDERIRATLLPGEPGWEQLFLARTDRPYDVGSYLTVWPNLMVNVFPDAVLGMWIEPIDATTTRVERRLWMAAGHTAEQRRAVIEAHRLVHAQDVDICLSVQRSHSAGLDADGVLSTEEEHGVFFVHERLRAALA